MTTLPLPAPRVNLRPLALPTEHGGWGFLCEPIALGLLLAPSWSGALIALSAVFAFLARHPLRLALQDAIRGRSFPRTCACRALAGAYVVGSLMAISGAVAIVGPEILVPFALAAPLAFVQIAHDATGRSRELLPELAGAAAMSSVAASIALADGLQSTAAYGLAAILIARFVPAILHVRAMLGRLPAWIALTAHTAALAAIAFWAPRLVIAAMVLLLMRAVWGVTHAVPSAKTIGWREIVYGALTVLLVAVALSR